MCRERERDVYIYIYDNNNDESTNIANNSTNTNNSNTDNSSKKVLQNAAALGAPMLPGFHAGLRGSHLSNTICLTKMFFKRGG